MPSRAPILRVALILVVLATVWLVFFRGVMQSTVPGPDRDGAAAAAPAKPESLAARLEETGELLLAPQGRGLKRDAGEEKSD